VTESLHAINLTSYFETEKKPCLLTDVSIPCDKNVLKKEAVTEIKRSTDRGTVHVERESETDTSINRSDMKLIKIISDVFRRNPWLILHRTAEDVHA
jgi:hypothetical protein